MEPLDPKAELMRLARECGDIERRACIGKAQGFDVRDSYTALESAITIALADARREALEEAAKVCGEKIQRVNKYERTGWLDWRTGLECATAIRALIDRKAGRT